MVWKTTQKLLFWGVWFGARWKTLIQSFQWDHIYHNFTFSIQHGITIRVVVLIYTYLFVHELMWIYLVYFGELWFHRAQWGFPFYVFPMWKTKQIWIVFCVLWPLVEKQHRGLCQNDAFWCLGDAGKTSSHINNFVEYKMFSFTGNNANCLSNSTQNILHYKSVV